MRWDVLLFPIFSTFYSIQKSCENLWWGSIWGLYEHYLNYSDLMYFRNNRNSKLLKDRVSQSGLWQGVTKWMVTGCHKVDGDRVSQSGWWQGVTKGMVKRLDTGWMVTSIDVSPKMGLKKIGIFLSLIENSRHCFSWPNLINVMSRAEVEGWGRHMLKGVGVVGGYFVAPLSDILTWFFIFFWNYFNFLIEAMETLIKQIYRFLIILCL